VPDEADLDLTAGEEVEGQLTLDDTSEQQITEPEKRYVEVDDPDSYYVRVKINGEDQEVPLSEALGGYSRTADYTRKTQELAQEREQVQFGLALQQAMAEDPAATMAFLAQRYGVTLPGGQQQPPAPEQEIEYADPLEKALAEERQARIALQERIEAREADELLQRTVAGIRQDFGANDEDLMAAAQYARQRNLPIEDLPLAYRAVMFDKIAAHARAQRMTREQQDAEAARRQAAAAAASGVVTTGSAAAGNGLTTQREIDDGRMDLRSAFEMAYEQATGTR